MNLRWILHLYFLVQEDKMSGHDNSDQDVRSHLLRVKLLFLKMWQVTRTMHGLTLSLQLYTRRYPQDRLGKLVLQKLCFKMEPKLCMELHIKLTLNRSQMITALLQNTEMPWERSS